MSSNKNQLSGNTEKKTVTCPVCGHTQSVTIYPMIDAKKSPKLKEDIIANKLFSYQCEKCGAARALSYFCKYEDDGLLIYHDPEYNDKSRMVLDLLSREAIKNAPDTTARVVKSTNDLREKIRINEAGLDDRFIELYKIPLLVDLSSYRPGFSAKAVYFDFDDEKEFFAVFGNKGEKLAVGFSRETYSSIKAAYGKRLSKEDNSTARIIDRSWAASLV